MKNFKKFIKPIAVTVPLACMLAAALPMQAMAAEPNIDVNNITFGSNLLTFTEMVDLDVYINDNWSGNFSDTYVYGETVEITAPEKDSNKNFSYWEAEGNILSYDKNIKISLTANTTLNAVYGKSVTAAAQSAPTVGFTSVNKDDDGNILLNAFTTDTNATEAGIYYSTTASAKNTLISGGTKETGTKDRNNCWTLTLKPETGKDYYYAMPYVTDGTSTYYGTVKKVRLSSLDFATSSTLDFDMGEDIDLDDINLSGIPTAEITKAPAGKSLTYNGKEQALITAGTAVGGTMQYSLDQYSGYSTELPTASESGTYTIWYKAAGDGSHLSTAPKSVTASISSAVVATKSSQLWTLTMDSYIYDGTAHEVTINGTTVGKVIYYYYNADTDKLLDEAPSEPGNYRVRVYASGSSSYYSRSQSVEYTISEVPAPSMYSVTVKNGTIDGKTSGEFAPNTVIAVKADKAKSGYQFGYWKRNNATASYNVTYTFPVTSDNIELEAVYLEADDEFTANGKCDKDSVTIDKENRTIAFAFLNNVPENCTIVKGGVVATSDISKLNDLAVGIGSNKEKTTFEKVFTTTKHNYKYTWTKGSIADGQAWYVRGYLIYKDADGKEITVYSNIEKATLNGSETIHDDKVVGTAVMDSVTKDTANKKMVFTSLLNVPADCTIKFAGIVSTSNAKKAENLTTVTVAEKTVTDGIYVRGMESTKHTVKYSWTKTNVGTETWYVRPYLVYTDALGTEQIVYGELTTAKLN